MAENSTTCDVAIVGSGFAGSFIANELSKKGIKVVILEAGPGVKPNFNEYMKSFYEASAKVPESPFPPAVLNSKGFIDPASLPVGRPSSLTLGASSWRLPERSYLDQSTSTLPFKSTYERLAGGTSHWMGLTPRLVPNDFHMKSTYFHGLPDDSDWQDWPIKYEDVLPYYDAAEKELGVAANVEDQHFANLSYSRTTRTRCREFRSRCLICAWATRSRTCRT